MPSSINANSSLRAYKASRVGMTLFWVSVYLNIHTYCIQIKVPEHTMLQGRRWHCFCTVLSVLFTYMVDRDCIFASSCLQVFQSLPPPSPPLSLSLSRSLAAFWPFSFMCASIALEQIQCMFIVSVCFIVHAHARSHLFRTWVFSCMCMSRARVCARALSRTSAWSCMPDCTFV